MSVKEEDLETIINDIIDIRSDPSTMIERFNIVLYSLKGFKKNETTVYFIEQFIDGLSEMEPAPRLTIDPYLNKVAEKIQKAADKLKIDPDRLKEDQISDIVKPLIRNYEHLNIIYETHSNPTKFLTKYILNQERGANFESPNLIALFDSSSNFIGGSGLQVGRTGKYCIVSIDKYEPVKKRSDISEEEYNEYKRLFHLFDIDHDGIITPKEFDEICSQTGIKKSWPQIVKFGKILFEKDPKAGVDLDDFIDAIIRFGLFDNEDAIRRIFDLYCDDPENDTLSMVGLKRIANDLEVEPYRGDMNLLYKFAVDKNASVTYKEFRDYIKAEVRKGNIVLPQRI